MAILGNGGVVHVGAVAVAEIRDYSIEQTSEVVASASMGDSWMTNQATQKSWTASFNAYWDADDAAQNALDVGASVAIVFFPEGNSSGNATYTGTAIVNSVSQSSSYDGLIEASFSVTGTGALVISSVPTPP